MGANASRGCQVRKTGEKKIKENQEKDLAEAKTSPVSLMELLLFSLSLNNKSSTLPF